MEKSETSVDNILPVQFFDKKCYREPIFIEKFLFSLQISIESTEFYHNAQGVFHEFNQLVNFKFNIIIITFKVYITWAFQGDIK